MKKVVLLKIFPERNKDHRHIGLHKCFCGTEFVCEIRSIKDGRTKSCGCAGKGRKRKQVFGERGNRLYLIYHGMLTRCYNIKDSAYRNYGGRGIKVCEEWKNNYFSFKNWAISHGYADHLTIDREDNDGDYTPDNCRWASDKVQCVNQRRRKSSTGLSGIAKTKSKKNPWQASIQINKESKYLGVFPTKELAAEAYEKAKKERDELYLKEAGLLKKKK